MRDARGSIGSSGFGWYCVGDCEDLLTGGVVHVVVDASFAFGFAFSVSAARSTPLTLELSLVFSNAEHVILVSFSLLSSSFETPSSLSV